MIGTIAARELRLLFLSPLAWSLLAVVMFILGWLFLTQLDLFMVYQPQLATLESPPGATEVIVMPLFSSATIILLLIMPLLTMRLVSEERRYRTLPLLLSAPLSMSEIILGKYLGVLSFVLLLLLFVALLLLSLLTVGSLDLGLLATGLLGLLLISAAFAAAGLFISTLTDQPAVAAVASFGLLLLLWVIDIGGREMREGAVGTVLQYLSLQRHYEPMLQGLLRSSDLIYFLLFIGTFLILAVRRLDADRLRG
ncbi:MAG: ABC transporter permease subunit [Gammaproteobacteria bacterium]|nr:ABC transporter permease subunit [Gammaproteobacteria bacterium]